MHAVTRVRPQLAANRTNGRTKPASKNTCTTTNKLQASSIKHRERSVGYRHQARLGPTHDPVIFFSWTSTTYHLQIVAIDSSLFPDALNHTPTLHHSYSSVLVRDLSAKTKKKTEQLRWWVEERERGFAGTKIIIASCIDATELLFL